MRTPCTLPLGPPLDYDVKMPNFSFYGGRNKPGQELSTQFLNLHIFIRNSTLREFAYI